MHCIAMYDLANKLKRETISNSSMAIKNDSQNSLIFKRAVNHFSDGRRYEKLVGGVGLGSNSVCKISRGIWGRKILKNKCYKIELGGNFS